MPEHNGDSNINKRLEDLEQMDKLLLRAQVLQQDALETLQSSIKRIDAWQERQEQWKKEQVERDRVLDQRIADLVSAIGQLIGKSDGGSRV